MEDLRQEFSEVPKDLGISAVMNDTLKQIFPHLTFEIPKNQDFWDNLKDKEFYEEIYQAYFGEDKSLEEFVLQSTIQPLFYSEEQKKSNHQKHVHAGDHGYSDGTKFAIGCKKKCTQIGGEPEYEDTELVGFGIPWPTSLLN